MNTEKAEIFEQNRRHLTGLAYRMLGAMSEAQDMVQEAYLRWHMLNESEIGNPRAFLAKIVTRLCLDHLKSARVKRETYIGPWLPEPLLDHDALKVYPSEHLAEDLAADLSVNFLLALERLSPLERAAFLLHDVFDMEFDAISSILDKKPPACRQLANRARTHIRAAKPRFEVSLEHGAELAQAFLRAVTQDDLAALTRLLAEDAVLHSDGGGKVSAALRPIHGPDKIARFFLGIARKIETFDEIGFQPSRINGLPGFVIVTSDGLQQTLSFESDATHIRNIYIIRNPDKLTHVGRL